MISPASTIRSRRPGRRSVCAAALLLAAAAVGCSESGRDSAPAGGGEATPRASAPAAMPAPPDSAFLDVLQERTFQYFWQLCDPRTGLAPDRAPTRSFASMAATGFALTVYPIGAERGWVTREEAARRTLDTLRFLWTAPQGDARSGTAGHRGFFYHFVDPETGRRFQKVELSTVDTALLVAGALFCASWFDGETVEEDSVRALSDSLYARVDWRWASPRPPAIGHGWTPENGFLPYDWRGYNEAMILYLLALGAPEHAVGPDAWSAWTSGYRWGGREGAEHLGFAPLFGHQYSHVWIDFRGIRDEAMRTHGIDYFENSRRAVYEQQAYAVENPGGWAEYGPRFWGLTACDGPVHGTYEIDGREREFRTYWARGVSFDEVRDDGTVCPSAAAASLAFAPEIVLPTLRSLHDRFGGNLFGRFGFLDALNPTFTLDVRVQHGRVDPEHGWFDTDYLGIDQGPIVAMIENHRSGLVWKTMRRNPHVVRGLRAAGFSGGWLDSLGTGP
jgi:hypothetical protein